jgi:hypothetical protein
LSYDVVKLTSNYRPAKQGEFGRTYEWRQIETRRGRTGWVISRYLSGPYGRPLLFKKLDGQWKLLAFAAGD